MKGRKPEPTAVKKIKGARPDRINEDEPQIVGTFPIAPSFLGREARLELKRLRREMKACPYVTTLDRGVLVSYCVAWENFVKNYEVVKKSGPFIKTVKGNIVQNPALSGLNKAMEQLIKISAELGFSPSSRSRIKVPRKGKKKGGIEEYLD